MESESTAESLQISENHPRNHRITLRTSEDSESLQSKLKLRTPWHVDSMFSVYQTLYTMQQYCLCKTHGHITHYTTATLHLL